MLSVKARFQSKPPAAWQVVGIALKQNHPFTDCIMFNIFAENYTFEENWKIHEQWKNNYLIGLHFQWTSFSKISAIKSKVFGKFP